MKNKILKLRPICHKIYKDNTVVSFKIQVKAKKKSEFYRFNLPALT
jgi:hypothetical protein